MQAERELSVPEIEILARAVILRGKSVLLARSRGADHTFLPGGHVLPGEAMAAAVSRELREELGVPCEIVSYLGAVEHAWADDAGPHHEINHCFLVTSDALDGSADPESREAQLEFLWADVGRLGERKLMPGPLRELVRELSQGTREVWWGTTLRRG